MQKLFKVTFISIIGFLVFTCASCNTDTAGSKSNSTDTMAYLSEKNRVYWEISENPDLIKNIVYSDVDWFSAWKHEPEQRKKLIDETIRLYQNKKGE